MLWSLHTDHYGIAGEAETWEVDILNYKNFAS